MKRLAIFTVSTLLCSMLASAVMRFHVRQLYDGEARPRSEVVWIWLDHDVHITDLDNTPLTKPTRPVTPCRGNLLIAELVPGKHVISIGYNDTARNTYSHYKLSLEIDAKAGEDYQVHSNSTFQLLREGKWSPTIAAFALDSRRSAKWRSAADELTAGLGALLHHSFHGRQLPLDLC